MEHGVTVIDKINYKIDGHIWYRVKLEDGTQGYISESYIQTIPDVKYKIEETQIKITPTTVITDIPGATLVGEVLGTGAKATIGEQEYTIVMVGDVNGDGLIDSADLLKIVKHLKGISKIDIEKSADVNSDGEIDSGDLLKTVKYLKGISTISI